MIADLTKCQGYATWLMLDAERVDLDEERYVRILRAARRSRPRRPWRTCPAQALRIEH